MKWHSIFLFLAIGTPAQSQTVRSGLVFNIDFTAYPPLASVCRIDTAAGICSPILLPKGTYVLPEVNTTLEIGENGQPNGECTVTRDLNEEELLEVYKHRKPYDHTPAPRRLKVVTYQIEDAAVKGYTTTYPSDGPGSRMYVSDIRDSIIYTNELVGDIRYSTIMKYYLRPEKPSLWVHYKSGDEIDYIEQIIGKVHLKLLYGNNELVRIEKLGDHDRVLLAVVVQNYIDRQLIEIFDQRNLSVYYGPFSKAKIREYLPEIIW